MERLRARVHGVGARIIHLTPPVFDPVPIRERTLPAGREEYRQPYEGYNEVLDRYSEWLLEQRAHGWEVIDVHGPINDYLRSRRVTQPEFTLAADGVHLNDEGHWRVAREILRYFDAPAEVCDAPDVATALVASAHVAAVLELIREKQRVLTDAWLKSIGHQRPGMNDGLPLAEATERARELEGEVNRLLQSGPVIAVRSPPQGYYRFPALRGDVMVFTAEGDLWTVGIEGGIARRLTTHPGTEAHAAISRDGTTVAFSAEYEGPTEVYSMPLTGGQPTRQTFDSGATVAGWTPDDRILYATPAFATLPNEQLVEVDPGTGRAQVMPLSQASEGVFGEDGVDLFFTRLPFQGSSTKRYRGGTAQNLWRFSRGEAEAVPLTADFAGTSKNPMVWQDRVYFLSDRDGTMNVWSMGRDGGDPRQHTRHRDLDVKSASLDGGRMVYQHGADLRLLDLPGEQDRIIPIVLATDFDQLRERWITKPMDYLTSARLSPKGDRVVLTARGQVFVAPVKSGRFVSTPRSAGVRYRGAQFLADGKQLLVLSDQSGELEFWTVPADGLGSARQLTRDATVFRFDPVLAPDGKRAAYFDKDWRLWILELEARQSRVIASSLTGGFSDLAWSPDGQWLAYVQAATNTYDQIHLYHAVEERRAIITSDRVNSFSPAWSPDGKRLYFLSDRQLRSLVGSPWGARQPEPFFTETTKIYELALEPGLRSPFRPGDELASDKTEAEPPKEPNDPPAEDKGKPPISVTIALDAIQNRVEEVPVKAGNYRALGTAGKSLFWLEHPTGFDAKSDLRALEITHDDPKPKTLVTDVKSYELSRDGKKLLVHKGDAFYVIAATGSAPDKLEETKVNLDGWTLSLTPHEEWRQIFTEAWRMLRDYFYDRDMHGVDWRTVLAKYLPLVDRVADRGDLSDLISEMVGELSALHVFVRFGDVREGTDQVELASLGAVLEADAAAGGWRVAHTYQSDPDYPAGRSPLDRPGVEVKEGDLLLRINGRPILSVRHPRELLRNQAGKQVLLDVKSGATGHHRQVIVRPITLNEEADLRYGEWEFTRRQQVERLGHGEIGYVHLRAMGAANIAEWARDYYPVFMRQGLIIDVRHNRGGNIDSWLLGRLLRQAWFFWQPRVGQPVWNMQYAFRGHLVVLCNERTASDGEAFTEGFRRLNLGKVIGTRTWGGEIWLSAQRWLVDRGMATAAETGVYGPEGEWLIEGHGVDPDIVVDNLPHATFLGKDAQLEAAIEHLQQRIAEEPRPIPPAPRYPDKSLK
jgi:tricorn protease